MATMADRFRRWYEYEKNCNAKALGMLESVPAKRRTDPDFQKAVDRLGHLVAARRRWLYRLGYWPEPPGLFPTGTELKKIPSLVAETEAAWTDYYGQLDDRELARAFEWVTDDGKRYRWDVESVLTQLFGHAWYHRGQIAQLVARLGGNAVDTDYIFWCNLTPLDSAAS